MFGHVKEQLAEAMADPAWDAELRRVVVATIHEIDDTILKKDLVQPLLAEKERRLIGGSDKGQT